MRINIASTKLAFLLIAALAGIIIISAIIPQQDFSDAQIIDWRESLGDGYIIIEYLALDRIYYTPTFFVIIALLAINLTFATVRRFRIIYKSERTLLKLRHFGSILFHLSLLLVMGGVILHYLYKYESVFSLTEGQSLSNDPGSFLREFKGALYTNNNEKYTIKLEEIGHSINEFDPLGSIAKIRLFQPNGQELSGEIATNKPFIWGETEFHFGSKTGYSPELLIIDSSGDVAFRSFMRVARKKHQNNDIHYDYIEIPGENLKVEIEVIPFAADIDSVKYDLKIFRGDVSLFSGELLSRDTGLFNGYKIMVPRLRRWCYIGAIKNPFLGMIFSGFWCGLLGLSLSLVARIVQGKHHGANRSD